MYQPVCIDIFVPKKQKWMEAYEFHAVNHPDGVYFTVEAELSSTYNSIIRECRRQHIRFRCYEKRWSRSPGCRQTFFDSDAGPYRCRYCHKKLTKGQVEVDHIIPVAKTKKLRYARMLLKIRGIQDVNDSRNLAPSCHKCNRRKGAQLGLWMVRGWLGKYRAYWIVLRTGLAFLACAAVYFLVRFLPHATEVFQSFIN